MNAAGVGIPWAALGSGMLGVALVAVVLNFLLKLQKQKNNCPPRTPESRCVADQNVKAALISQAVMEDHMRQTRDNTQKLLEKMTEQASGIKTIASEAKEQTRCLKEIASNSKNYRPR